jgi:hypothetical protein
MSLIEDETNKIMLHHIRKIEAKFEEQKRKEEVKETYYRLLLVFKDKTTKVVRFPTLPNVFRMATMKPITKADSSDPLPEVSSHIQQFQYAGFFNGGTHVYVEEE